MNTPNIDLLLSDIEFRQGRAAKMLEVTVYDGDLVTRFDAVDILDLIDEVRALREHRDAERAVIEAAMVWLDATGAEKYARAQARLASATYDYRTAVATTLSEAP